MCINNTTQKPICQAQSSSVHKNLTISYKPKNASLYYITKGVRLLGDIGIQGYYGDRVLGSGEEVVEMAGEMVVEELGKMAS